MEPEEARRIETARIEVGEMRQLRLIIDRLSIRATLGITLRAGMFPTVENPPCASSGASSWTASAGGTSAFSI